MQTDLIRFTGNIARITFDKERKLKATHGAISRALTMASTQLGRPVSAGDLIGDVFVGQRYLLLALLAPNLQSNENLTLDKVSDLIDQYRAKGGKPGDLQTALSLLLADYMGIETKPDEEDDADPNATAPTAPGPSGDEG